MVVWVEPVGEAAGLRFKRRELRMLPGVLRQSGKDDRTGAAENDPDSGRVEMLPWRIDNGHLCFGRHRRQRKKSARRHSYETRSSHCLTPNPILYFV